MEKGNKEKAIGRAKEYLSKGDASHGLAHASRVLDYAMKIAESHPEADKEIVEIAAWWHDVGRIYHDKGHQKKSAEMAKEELPNFGFSKSFSEEIYEAIVDHSSHADELPKNVEGKIIKDADKLEFLTLERWQETMDAKLYHYIEVAIHDIPMIRNRLLLFPESKVLFDKLLLGLQQFAASARADGWNRYKEEITNLNSL